MQTEFRVPLSKDKYAIVSEEDHLAALLSSSWCYDSRTGYVFAKYNQKKIYLHKFVADRMGLKGQIDHENRNRLDNRRSNLRESNQSQNTMNREIPINESGYRGVSRNYNGWRARIHSANKEYNLGTFSNPEEAAIAYDKKAIELFGEFAMLNFGS